MNSTSLLFSSIPGLEGLIAQPTAQAAASTPPRPPSAPAVPASTPPPAPEEPKPTESVQSSPLPPKAATAPAGSPPGGAQPAAGMQSLQMPANYGSARDELRFKEDNKQQAISLFAQDDDSMTTLQRRIDFLQPGMTVSVTLSLQGAGCKAASGLLRGRRMPGMLHQVH